VDKEEGKELKVIARGPWGARGGPGQQQLVLRSAKELAEAMGMPEDKAAEAAAKLFKVDAIDWKTQMIVAATGGTRRTGGYRVEIENLTVKDGTLTVHWKLHSPKPGEPVTQTITHPAQAALVERFEGKTEFDPPAVKGEKESDK
jgi:hypothetical protein